MEAHFTWFGGMLNGISENHYIVAQSEKFILAFALAFVLLILGKKAATRIKADRNSLIIPTTKLSLFGFFDLFIESFAKYQDTILGKENRKYLPLTCSVFMFIFFANILGLIPGVASITTTVWVNVGIALIVFCAFNYYGIVEHGIIGYLKHFCGPVWWMAFLVFPLELFSTILRVLTLNLRLYWNITADHIVLGIFTDITKLFVPVLFYGLGTFVCFMQAFVFATLTMVYILLATQHAEEAHH